MSAHPKACAFCNKPLRGRADKKYCNIQCKNSYASRLRFLNLPVRQRVDRFLHRNHTILYELDQKKKGTKWYVTKTILQKSGFRFNCYTGSYMNKQGKTYYHIYDYRWMEFSDTTILVVRNQT